MKIKRIIFFSILFCINNVFGANVIDKIIRFEKSDLKFSKVKQYDRVTINELELQFEDGKPQLPFKLIHVSVPAGKKISGVNIINVTSEKLSNKYFILPCQPQLPLSLINNDEIKLIDPDKSIYTSSISFPEKSVHYLNSGEIQGKMIASFAVYPLQYIPNQKVVIFNSEIFFQIILDEINSEPEFKKVHEIDDASSKLGEPPPLEEHRDTLPLLPARKWLRCHRIPSIHMKVNQQPFVRRY